MKKKKSDLQQIAEELAKLSPAEIEVLRFAFPYGVGIQRQLKLVAPLYPVYVTVHIGTVAVGMMMAGFSTFQNSPTDY